MNPTTGPASAVVVAASRRPTTGEVARQKAQSKRISSDDHPAFILRLAIEVGQDGGECTTSSFVRRARSHLDSVEYLTVVHLEPDAEAAFKRLGNADGAVAQRT